MQSHSDLLLGSLVVISPSNTQSSLPAGLVRLPSSIKAFSVGFNFALLVDQASRLYSWGFNAEFQRLGRAVPIDHTDTEPTPVQIPGNSAIIACASGANHSVVLSFDGTVFSLGSNDCGQLGRLNPDPLPARVPIPVPIKYVCAGWNFSVAVPEDRRSLYTWGSGKDGQLGHGYFPSEALPTRVRLQGSLLYVSAGHAHIVVLLETDSNARKVLTWGADGLPSTRQDLPRSIPRLPEQEIIKICAGNQFTLFLSEHGVVFAVGNGDQGQLGVGDAQGRNYACVVPGLLGHFIVGIEASDSFAIALSQEGTFFTWGNGVTKPRRLRHGLTGIVSSFPNSYYVQMKAFASTALVAAPNIASPSTAVRHMRAFLSSFCDGPMLDEMKSARVYYRCSCPDSGAGRCDRCFVLAYGPLLATGSVFIRSEMQRNNDQLDWSDQSKECVTRTIKLLCCGVINGGVAVSTLQGMSELLTRCRAHLHERVVAQILMTRLLRRSAQVRDYWDAYDHIPETRTERRLRAILGRLPDSERVRVCLKYGPRNEDVIQLPLDPIVACAHSAGFREFLSSHLQQHGSATSLQWVQSFRGQGVHGDAITFLKEWLRGEENPRFLEAEAQSQRVPVLLDVIRISACLQITLLLLEAERLLVQHLDSSITMSVWWEALHVTKETGCAHAHLKLLYISDSVCAAIKLKHELIKVKKMEESSSLVDALFDTAQAKRKALRTYRRARVFCDWHFSTREVAKTLQEAVEMEGIRIGEGNIRLDEWKFREEGQQDPASRMQRNLNNEHGQGRRPRALSRCAIS